VNLDRPHRVVFTWGFVGLDELPPGSSTVEVTFTAEGGGTLVSLEHRGLPSERARTHKERWTGYLAHLAKASSAVE
jgi:uncharacterized protein YndB with AHSA1/START domain